MSRPLRVGLQLPEVEREVRWPEVREMALLAEAVGFDSLWLGDHLLYRDAQDRATGPWEAWTSLAALAEATSRVTIGPLVAATAFHAPAMLAKIASTVDEISGGRLILGLGAGWNETEFRGFGFPYDRRIDRFAEAFTIIRTLLRTGDCEFDGEFYRVERSALRPRAAEGRPPIMIGSIGPRMLSLTIPYADSWNAWHAWFGNQPDGLAPLRAKVDAACLAAGRDPAEVERTAAVLVATPEGIGRKQGGDEPRSTASGADQPITGTPQEIAVTLHGFARAGLAEVQVVLDPITFESIEWMRPVLESLDA